MINFACDPGAAAPGAFHTIWMNDPAVDWERTVPEARASYLINGDASGLVIRKGQKATKMTWRLLTALERPRVEDMADGGSSLSSSLIARLVVDFPEIEVTLPSGEKHRGVPRERVGMFDLAADWWWRQAVQENPENRRIEGIVATWTRLALLKEDEKKALWLRCSRLESESSKGSTAPPVPGGDDAKRDSA